VRRFADYAKDTRVAAAAIAANVHAYIRVHCVKCVSRKVQWRIGAILSGRSGRIGIYTVAYRISYQASSFMYAATGHARRSAVGDMFVGHDLLPTSATVNLVVTTSTPSAVRRARAAGFVRCCADAALRDVEVTPLIPCDNLH